MMKGMKRVALMLALALVGTTTGLQAATVDGKDGGTHEIRVVNNYQAPVRVYAQDADGKLHQLGRVARGTFRVLELPNEVAEMGDLRLKVYPASPAWSLLGDEDGIRTKDLHIGTGQAVNVYLETDLTRSMIQVENG